MPCGTVPGSFGRVSHSATESVSRTGWAAAMGAKQAGRPGAEWRREKHEAGGDTGRAREARHRRTRAFREAARAARAGQNNRQGFPVSLSLAPPGPVPPSSAVRTEVSFP
jgi:hypothetical protein